MRAVVQRVSSASVTVDGSVVGRIDGGLCVLLGATHDDSVGDAHTIADKLAGLRIFADAGGLMNRSVLDVGGAVLVVSQFTLYGDVRRGRRPSFADAARPDVAEPLVDAVVERLRASGVPVESGRFRAMMEVALVNDGPVTVVIETAGGRIV